MVKYVPAEDQTDLFDDNVRVGYIVEGKLYGFHRDGCAEYLCDIEGNNIEQELKQWIVRRP